MAMFWPAVIEGYERFEFVTRIDPGAEETATYYACDFDEGDTITVEHWSSETDVQFVRVSCGNWAIKSVTSWNGEYLFPIGPDSRYPTEVDLKRASLGGLVIGAVLGGLIILAAAAAVFLYE